MGCTNSTERKPQPQGSTNTTPQPQGSTNTEPQPQGSTNTEPGVGAAASATRQNAPTTTAQSTEPKGDNTAATDALHSNTAVPAASTCSNLKLVLLHPGDHSLEDLRSKNNFVWYCKHCARVKRSAFVTFNGTADELHRVLCDELEDLSFGGCGQHEPELYVRNTKEGEKGEEGKPDDDAVLPVAPHHVAADTATEGSMEVVYRWVQEAVGDSSTVDYNVYDVFVNRFTLPLYPTVRSFWFHRQRTPQHDQLDVFTYDSFDPTKVVDLRESDLFSGVIKYTDGTRFKTNPATMKSIASAVPMLEASVKAVFTLKTLPLRLRFQPFDRYGWFNGITQQEPSRFACSTATLKAEKRTVLAVAGEAGIGKTKWVTEMLPKLMSSSQSPPVPIVVKVSGHATEFAELDQFAAQLTTHPDYESLKGRCGKLQQQLGRNKHTIRACEDVLKAVTAHADRRRIAFQLAVKWFTDQLAAMNPSYMRWLAMESDRVISSHVLLVLDEIGANLNVAHGLLSEPYIQAKLSEALFGTDTRLENEEKLRVDLVLCGTSADSLNAGWQTFSTDPGALRLMIVSPSALGNEVAFGDDLWISAGGADFVTMKDLPLQHWVQKVLSNPRLAHAFIELLVPVSKSGNRPTEPDVATAITGAMLAFVTMNGLNSVSQEEKRLLMDIAYRELTFSRYVRAKKERTLYLGKLRVNWETAGCQTLFNHLTARVPAAYVVPEMLNAITKRPTTGMTELDDYDSRGKRLPLYRAFCLVCVTLGLLTYNKDKDVFQASPALQLAVCLRFGQVVVPAAGDAFENLTCLAIERGLIAQGFTTVSGTLSFFLPHPSSKTFTQNPSRTDPLLALTRRHLEQAGKNDPRAVVIKNGPSAPAADIIILTRRILDDANEPDQEELQLIVVGCKHNNYAGWKYRLQHSDRNKVETPEGKDYEAKNEIRDWLTKWSTLGVVFSFNPSVIQYRDPNMRKAEADADFLRKHELRTLRGSMLKTFFTTFLSECASPHSRLTMLHVLQESFESSVDNWPDRAYDCFVHAPAGLTRVAYGRDDLGLFSELIVRPLECDNAVVWSPLLQNVPVCPDCCKLNPTFLSTCGLVSLSAKDPIDRRRPVPLSLCGSQPCRSVLVLSAGCRRCKAPSNVTWLLDNNAICTDCAQILNERVSRASQ